MGTITIKNLIGGNINIITTGGSDEPTGHEKTWIWFEGQEKYQEFDWSGEIDHQIMTDAGLWADYSWTKYPVKVEIGTKVTGIGDYAFSGCPSLASVTIGNGVTIIRNGAFSQDHSLTSVTIGNDVTSIGENAFYDCTNLTTITLGNGVTSIGENAFNSCSHLTSITIPDSVTSIGDSAFTECSSLAEITIGNGVTYFGQYVFYDCTNLTSASILGFTQAEIVENASVWMLGYQFDDNWNLITFPVTVTAKDGVTFVLHQS